MAQTGPGEAGRNQSLTNVAVALAAATVLAVIVLASIGADGAIWVVQGALAAAAAVAGYLAGGRSPQNTLAFAAMTVGVVLFLVFVGFAIAEA